MHDKTTTSTDSPRAGFAASAAQILRQTQAAVADLLFGVGLDGARSSEIGRTLGLDKTLAWKVGRFAREEDPLSAARHMPGPAGIKILLDAAAGAGAPSDRIEAVRQADAAFRQFVEARAGDLRTFEAMLVGSSRDNKAELEQRRAYYQSAAAVWGVRASAQFLMLALCPAGREDGMLDVVQTSGFVRLERLRPNTPWIVRRLKTTTDDGQQQLSFARVPLDPSGASAVGALPLLREFCSDPPPQIRQFLGCDGVTYDELSPGPLGPSGAVTVITGELYRAALPSKRSADNRYGGYKLVVRTPVEHVVVDVLVHKELNHFGPMMMSIEGLLEGRPSPTDPEERHHADTSTPAKFLGRGPVLKTARLPVYERVARRALELAAQNPDDFCGYRAAIDYPVVPCEIMLSCAIGEEGSRG
jgi:hypothetical protein